MIPVSDTKKRLACAVALVVAPLVTVSTAAAKALTFPAGFTAYVHTAEHSQYGGSELDLVVTGVRLHLPPASKNCANIRYACAFKAVNVSGSVSEETNGAPASYTCAGQVPPFYSRSQSITPVAADAGKFDSYVISVSAVYLEFEVAFFAKVHLSPPGDAAREGLCTFSYVNVLPAVNAKEIPKYTLGQADSVVPVQGGSVRIVWVYA